MSRLNLSFACSEYDHVTDLVTGAVPVSGISLNTMFKSTEEIFFRTARFQEFDIAEMSLARYIAMRAAGDHSLFALPVFPSRFFRQSAIFVDADGPVKKVSQLNDARIGVPEWAQTAGVYVRGWLAEDCGVNLASVHWHQGGIKQAGREESLSLELPEDIRITRVADRTLPDMLLNGELDALITAHPPAAADNGRLVPLVRDSQQVAVDWYQRTGVYPIMHVIVLKTDVYERHPWIATNLFAAFDEARRNSMQRALTLTASRFPFAFTHEAASQAKALFGDDFFPYGVDANRPTLETFLRYCTDQGLATATTQVDELFVPEVAARHAV